MFEAEVYADAPDAGEEAKDVTISREAIDRTTLPHVHLASGGGNAMWIHPGGGQGSRRGCGELRMVGESK
jgi:hypothetical protein